MSRYLARVRKGDAIMSDQKPQPIRNDADKRTNRENLDDSMDFVAKKSSSQESERGSTEEHVGGGGAVREDAKDLPDT